jgi:hypothetical protein
MTDSRHSRRRRWSLPLLATTLVLAAPAAYLASSSNAGPAAAAGQPTPAALYPALASTAPLGLTLSSSASAPQPDAQQPTWRTPSGAEGNRPAPQTIRRLPSDAAQVDSWIAESTTGGICVLLSPARSVTGTRPVAATCTEGASRLTEGTYLSYQYPETNEVALAGVAPAGTTAMHVTFADGTTQSVPVQGNGWSLQSTRVPVSLTASPEGVTVQIGGV